MRTYLSFETAVADIEARLDELRAVAEKGDSPALAEEIARLEARADKALADLYASLTPWQKTHGRARPGPSAFRRLRQGAHHRVHAPRRRPLFRRGRSHRRRPRKIRGRVGLCPRPGEGRRHGEPGAAQFRHGAAGRLSQGGAADGACRPFRPAGDLPHRHRGRLPGRRSRGARPGRSHRPLDRRLSRRSARPMSG